MDDFDSLIERVRQGDAVAAARLVREFEPAVRVAVRARLNAETRRQFDSMDICQSVFGSFFVRMAAGQYDLRQPAQLMALLTKTARNKLACQVRRAQRQRRDVRRSQTTPAEDLDLHSTEPDPARNMQGKELLQQAWQRMDPQLREMALLRVSGQTWQQVARVVGGTVAARKKQFQRGIGGIARELGIDDVI